MFILFDTRSFNRRLDFDQPMTCPHCGHFGRYEVFVVGTRFRLFFIPLFTFGKKYLVHTTCCNSWYELDKQTGKAIQKNQSVHIEESDLTQLLSQGAYTSKCPNCGQPNPEQSNFCPNCGQPLS